MIPKCHRLLSYKGLIFAVVLFFIFLFVYKTIFDPKIDLGGDNISYYLLGKSIADGHGYTDTHHIEQNIHNHYPSGYPVLISCVYSFFPNNINALKIFNGVLFYLSLGRGIN